MEESAVDKEPVEELETYRSAIKQLREALDAHPDDPSPHFNIGLFLWEKGRTHDKAAAADHFLKSAKLDPRNGAVFKYLGHYYASVSIDIDRALKCYQRAVSLDADDFISGEALCDLLHHQEKESLEVAICKEASAKSPRAFWAFRRLGYLQVYQKKWAEAVLSLQHAIRGYPACADLWEALGLAYQRLGRFTAAIKSYARAIEIEDGVFAWVESGNIFLMLGSYKKGVEHFQQALEISPKSVAAQFGLSSGLLGLAKECITRGAFKWASVLLEEASKVARGSTRLAGNLSCIWKLLGDIQLMYAKCYPWMEEDWGLGINSEAFRTSVLSWKQMRNLASLSARRFYQQALHLAPWEANIYTDIAITSDLISSLNDDSGSGLNAWQISEKMTLGALMLEGDNHEFWVAMGCLSNHYALKQHAFIRALQLDVSLAVAWAYLGKLYRNRGEKQLARHAFDYARSIDPLLAIPWAGMSADFNIRESTSDEAFESCLRAAQILPVAEFQIGLAKLSLQAGHLSSPQVYGAIRQAIQLAPCYPESHNLNGLAFEAQLDYPSAAASYRLARLTISHLSDRVLKFRDISINLARSLCKAGHVFEALQECENLKKEGMLDVEGLQIYALSLWKFGENDQALTAARTLAANLSTMERTCMAASVGFICRLLYSISGLDPAISSIMKMPNDFFQSSKMSFIVSAIHAIDWSDRLDSIVSSSRSFLKSHEEITRMHFLIALTKLIKHQSENRLGFLSGVAHLRKALHVYPNSSLIRNLLGYLLLSNDEWNGSHTATRCCNMYAFDQQNKEGLKSAYEIHGAGAVACYTIGTSNPRFSFPTCLYHCQNGIGTIRQLQKCLHQEPWNFDARYLLVLNFLQKAREERFPHHLRVMIERLILVAFSNELYINKDVSHQYKKFQLLLCASEISFHGGSQIKCIRYAEAASSISVPDDYLFCAHLLLCRAYAAEDDSINLQKEFIRCLDLKTDNYLGWISLKFIASRYKLHVDSNVLDLSFKECSKGRKNPQHMSIAIFSLVEGLISFWSRDFMTAEKFFAQASSFGHDDGCHLLCHGATCMELAKQFGSSDFLMLAVSSLIKAQAISVAPIPIVSIMLAQAEGSLGLKEKWESNLRFEWFSWPPDMRSAELLFQMHLLAKQSKVGSDPLSVELCQSPLRWVLRAIHVNPSCMRYWKVLGKLVE